MLTRVQIRKLKILYHLLTVKCLENLCPILDCTLWMIGLNLLRVVCSCLPMLSERDHWSCYFERQQWNDQPAAAKGRPRVCILRANYIQRRLDVTRWRSVAGALYLIARRAGVSWRKSAVSCRDSCCSITLQRHDMPCTRLSPTRQRTLASQDGLDPAISPKHRRKIVKSRNQGSNKSIANVTGRCNVNWP